MRDTPKLWAKANVTLSTAKVIKRIASDTDRFVYEVIDEVFKKEYPSYFAEN